VIGDQPVVRPLPIHTTTQTQNKQTLTSMPPVGLEPTISVLERAKPVHALDRAATVIDFFIITTANCIVLLTNRHRCKLQLLKKYTISSAINKFMDSISCSSNFCWTLCLKIHTASVPSSNLNFMTS
jgi:hypothetical protein